MDTLAIIIIAGLVTIIILVLYAIALVFGLGIAAIGLAAMN